MGADRVLHVLDPQARGVDRFGPDGAAALVAGGARAAKRFQSGYVYTYALVMLIGLAAAVAWFVPSGFMLGGR